MLRQAVHYQEQVIKKETGRGRPIRVFMITSEWPSAGNPNAVPFVVRQVNYLREAGVEVEVFSFRGARNLLNYMRAWWRARIKLWQNTYDVIHAQWGQSGVLAIPNWLPVIVTFRGGEVEGIVGDTGKYTLSGYVLRIVSYWVAKYADELIIVSAHMRPFLPRRPIHVIPSGLDFDRLPIISQQEARKQLGLPLSKRLVLFVDSTVDSARKRYSLAEKVVSRLELELDAQLVVAKGVPNAKIPIYMNACDALLFTSMYEGSPNVVKEALACNLPVVSVAVGDVSERLRGVECCSVCTDDRPETIARELDRILRLNRRANGRAAVRDLDERLLTNRIIDIYRSVLAQRA
jgi:glycosyltransferase involved in cell wall biosynthesis